MGIIALALFGAQTDGTLDDLPAWLSFLHPRCAARTDIDSWIKLTCALVMAAGTAAGGWRIIKTLGHKMVKLHPINGFAAETASRDDPRRRGALRHAGVDHAQHLHRDHGRGLRQELRARSSGPWSRRMVWAWILTIPAAGGIAYGLFRLVEMLGWA